MFGQFEGFCISRIIFHKIFKRDENGIVPPVYNSSCETLAPKEKSTIEERIVKAIGNNSKALQMDVIKNGEGSVFKYVIPAFVRQLDEAEFIGLSKNITDKLVEAQSTRRMPGGVVAVFEGKTGIHSQRYIGIIKAEEDNGFTLESADSRLLLKFIDDLLLTKNQKIYKVAIIIDKGEGKSTRDPGDVDVYIYDSNNNVAHADARVTYFYDAFMGCTFQKSSEILTRNFYNSTKTFINTSDEISSERKIDLVGALYSYLKFNASPIINVEEFANTYFAEAEIKDKYAKFMEERKIPTNSIHKDLSLISSKLKKRKIRFTNSITLEAPVDDFDRTVVIKENDNDNSTVITIKAKISSEE